MSRRLMAMMGLLVIGSTAALVACSSAGVEEPTEEAGEDALIQGAAVPTLGVRIDRIGRPEVTNFLVRDPRVKEVYNEHDSFAVPAESAQRYRGLFKASIAMYDGYDGVADMNDETVTKLSNILVDDFLRIDLTKPCSGVSSTGYFDIERAELLGEASKSCGGRSPNEDAFDTLATFYTNGPSKLTPRVTDLVDKSTGIAGNAFPYLVKPHLLRTPPPATPPATPNP